MNNPLITLIVPVYNVEKYLAQCVESLISQTYANIEIILVDDGSIDDSGKLCDKYASFDNRIKVIHKLNGGLSDARNAGLAIAKGEYVGFVDSDDWVEPNMYEVLLDSILRKGCEISVCGYSKEYLNQTIEYCNDEDTVYCNDDALYKLIENNELQDHAWALLSRRELWQHIEFPKGKYYEDVYTTWKLFLKAKNISVIKQSLYHYRQRGGSITQDGFNSRKLDLLKAIESFEKAEELSEKYSDIIRYRIIKTKYTLLWELLMFGNRTSVQNNIHFIKEWYSSIQRNKSFILSYPNTQKSLKQVAMLSFFNYKVIQFLLKLKKHNYLQKKLYD